MDFAFYDAFIPVGYERHETQHFWKTSSFFIRLGTSKYVWVWVCVLNGFLSIGWGTYLSVWRCEERREETFRLIREAIQSGGKRANIQFLFKKNFWQINLHWVRRQRIKKRQARKFTYPNITEFWLLMRECSRHWEYRTEWNLLMELCPCWVSILVGGIET